MQKAFLLSSQAMGPIRAQTFLGFNCRVKILWADPDNMQTLLAIFFTVSLASRSIRPVIASILALV